MDIPYCYGVVWPPLRFNHGYKVGGTRGMISRPRVEWSATDITKSALINDLQTKTAGKFVVVDDDPILSSILSLNNSFTPLNTST